MESVELPESEYNRLMNLEQKNLLLQDEVAALKLELEECDTPDDNDLWGV